MWPASQKGSVVHKDITLFCDNAVSRICLQNLKPLVLINKKNIQRAKCHKSAEKRIIYFSY